MEQQHRLVGIRESNDPEEFQDVTTFDLLGEPVDEAEPCTDGITELVMPLSATADVQLGLRQWLVSEAGRRVLI